MSLGKPTSDVESNGERALEIAFGFVEPLLLEEYDADIIEGHRRSRFMSDLLRQLQRFAIIPMGVLEVADLTIAIAEIIQGIGFTDSITGRSPDRKGTPIVGNSTVPPTYTRIDTPQVVQRKGFRVGIIIVHSGPQGVFEDRNT